MVFDVQTGIIVPTLLQLLNAKPSKDHGRIQVSNFNARVGHPILLEHKPLFPEGEQPL